MQQQPAPATGKGQACASHAELSLQPIARELRIQPAHAALDDSLLEVVPDAPHSMYWERPELFNAAVAKLTAALNEHETVEATR